MSSINKDILVVDDDSDIRDAITQVLQLEGYNVKAVQNGEEGLNEINIKKPDLILLDLMMPVMNSWQFKSELDNHPDFNSIPVVVLSANGRIKDECKSIGVKEYLSKPIKIEGLLGVVQKYCN